MKILFFTQYFWPENFLINDLARELSKTNVIKTITSYPNYPTGKYFKGYKLFFNKNETWNKINISRVIVVPRKKGKPIDLIINYLSFAFFSFFKLLFLKNKKQYELCFVYAPSPLISLISIFLLKKIFNFKIYLWLQDLWPLVIYTKTNSNILKRFIFLICKFIYKKSDLILVQSHDYTKYLVEQFNISEHKIIFFPNWSQNQQKVNFQSSKKNKYKIIYTGNIGTAQNLSILVEICKNYKLSNFEFHLYGDGRFKEQLKNEILKNKINNIFLHSPLPLDKLILEIEKYDVLFLSLSKEFSHTIPVKFQFYLSLGLPIIASVDGYLKDLINSKKIGFASEANESNKLEEAFKSYSKLSEKEKTILVNNSYTLYTSVFSRDKAIIKINKLIREKNCY